MAVLNHEQQQELEAAKAFWTQYGRYIVAGVIAALLIFAGVQGWRYYSAQQNNAAGALYDQLLTAADNGDTAKVNGIATTLTDKYGGTGYARLAALVAARVSFDDKDAAGAQKRLEWLVKHADGALRDDARLRLGAVLLNQKKYPDVLTLLDEKHAPAFDALYSDLKGDAFAAQGRAAEARAAYQFVLDHADEKSPQHAIAQMKFDALSANSGAGSDK